MTASPPPPLERREARWLAGTTLVLGVLGALFLRLDAVGFSLDALDAGADAGVALLEAFAALLLLRPLLARDASAMRLPPLAAACLALLPSVLLVASVAGGSPLALVEALAVAGLCGAATWDLVALGDSAGRGLAARALVLALAGAAPLAAYVTDEFLRVPPAWGAVSPLVLVARVAAGGPAAGPLAVWIAAAAALRIARSRRGASAPAASLCFVLAAPVVRTPFADAVVPGSPLPISVELPEGFRGDLVVDLASRRTVAGPFLGSRAFVLVRPGAGGWPSSASVVLRDAAGNDVTRSALEPRPLPPGAALGLVLAGDGEIARRVRDRLDAADAEAALRWIVPDASSLPPTPAAFDSADAIALVSGLALEEPAAEAIRGWIGAGGTAWLVESGGDGLAARFADGVDPGAGTGRLGLGVVRRVRLADLESDGFRLPSSRAPSPPPRALRESPPGPPILPAGGRVGGPSLSRDAALVLLLTAAIGVGLAALGRRRSRGAFAACAIALPGVAAAAVALGPLRSAPVVATTADVVELRANSPRGRVETLVEVCGVADGAFELEWPDAGTWTEWSEAPIAEPLVDRVRPADGVVRTEGLSIRARRSRLLRVAAPLAAAGTLECARGGAGIAVRNRLPMSLERCIVLDGESVVASLGTLAPGDERTIRPSAPRPLRAEWDERAAAGLGPEVALLRGAAATGRFSAGTLRLAGWSDAPATSAASVSGARLARHAGSLWIVELAP